MLLQGKCLKKENVSEYNFKTLINKSKNHCDDFLYIHKFEMKGFGKFFNLEGGGGGDGWVMIPLTVLSSATMSDTLILTMR